MHSAGLSLLCHMPAAAENIMSFDQRFWLRLATRSDAATDDEQRKQLSDLAKVRLTQSKSCAAQMPGAVP